MAGPELRSSADKRLAALFPEEHASTAQPRWRRRSTLLVALAVVAALVVGGVVATSAFGSSGSSYRTATAGPEQVDSVLTGVATIEPVAQATVAFPVAGTVASVNVTVGDQVAAGGVLASLDPHALTETLHTRQATLAQAQLNLSKALSGQSVASPSSGAGSGGAGAGGATSSGAATTSALVTGSPTADRIVLTAATPPDPALAAAQRAVLGAQHDVDTAMTAANTAIAAEGTACAAFVATTGGSAAAPPPSPPSVPDATACQQAINDVLAAQKALAHAQTTLQAASTALDTLLAQRAATPPTTTPTPSGGGSGAGGSAAGGTAASGAGATGASRSTASGGSSPSAADLVAYQASVDAAAASVAAAQQAVDSATIASPLAGSVVGVTLHVGDTVTANSSTADIVVQGAGGYEVSTAVSVDNIPSVSVGQAATVVPDGLHRSLTGRVVAISLVPASTSSSSTLYRVMVGLTNPGAPLHNGATGTVAVVTKQARAALAVPTSAVTATRNRHTVTVLEGGSPTVVLVQVGVIGSTWTEIKSGLTAGQEVVLADVSAPLPDSATASTNSTQGTTRTGGFGGFGGFPGGTGGSGGTGNRGINRVG
jgi:multidrug efflux pump subunit AcrA (membrane-fusion protein)